MAQSQLLNQNKSIVLKGGTKGAIAIDNGGKYTKVLNHIMTEVAMFRSAKVSWFDIGIAEEGFNNDQDYDVEWNGGRFFVGKIAERETNAMPFKGFTDSKSTDFFILSALIAIHQYGFDENFVITDIPIEQFKIPTERAAVKERLEDEHTLIVNGVKKTFKITEACVMAECINAFWVDQPFGRTRWLDLGSRTINFGTLDRDGQEVEAIESESGTLPFGLEKIKVSDYASFAKSLEGQLGQYNWKKNDDITIFGGGALISNGILAQELQQLFPSSVIADDPQGIQARGMLLLGVADAFIKQGFSAAIAE